MIKKDKTVDAIENKYAGFCSQLENFELAQLAESRSNILFDFNDAEFFLHARDFQCDRNAIIVFNSDGMADVPLNPDSVMKMLIEDADAELEAVRYDDRFSDAH